MVDKALTNENKIINDIKTEADDYNKEDLNTTVNKNNHISENMFVNGSSGFRCKPIKIADIPNILQDISQDNKDICISDESDSELNEEALRFSDHNSESEQECDLEDDVVDRSNSNQRHEDFYIGRDKITLWHKTPNEKTSANTSKATEINPEVKEYAKNITGPADAFNKIIDFDIIDEIVIYTNKCIKKVSKKSSDLSLNVPTSRFEVMALFGIFFHISIKQIRLKHIPELWATDGTGFMFIRASMNYKRFLFLLKCLRFSDIKTEEEEENEVLEEKPVDKLAEIRSILNLFLANIQKCYSTSEFLTVDELYLPYCSSYSESKRKTGLKIFILCDTKTFYCNNLEICIREQPEGPYKLSNSPKDVVNRLVTENCRTVCMDSWFTSLDLCNSLLEKEITLIGALNKDRSEIPESFLPNNTKELGSNNFGYQDDKTLISHTTNKNKSVILLTTKSYADKIDNDNKPEILNQYNRGKNVVNDLGKILSHYDVPNISKRWSFTIFNFLLNLASLNAQILYSMVKPEEAQHSRRSFLLSLGIELMKEHLYTRAKEPCLPSDITLFLMTNYSLSTDGDENYEPPSKKRGTCILCGWRRNSSTTIKCSKCCKFTCKRHSQSKIICYNCMENDD